MASNPMATNYLKNRAIFPFARVQSLPLGRITVELLIERPNPHVENLSTERHRAVPLPICAGQLSLFIDLPLPGLGGLQSAQAQYTYPANPIIRTEWGGTKLVNVFTGCRAPFRRVPSSDC